METLTCGRDTLEQAAGRGQSAGVGVFFLGNHRNLGVCLSGAVDARQLRLRAASRPMREVPAFRRSRDVTEVAFDAPTVAWGRPRRKCSTAKAGSAKPGAFGAKGNPKTPSAKPEGAPSAPSAKPSRPPEVQNRGPCARFSQPSSPGAARLFGFTRGDPEPAEGSGGGPGI